ncbi:hypothetical protein ACLGIH_11855 [Streptomyces sp. HMX87]|uniref:hypothetical protein n=1 Tax=Streptomyces sp. HMX87 TaxID=3390849 RepID=UPI003A88BD0F
MGPARRGGRTAGGLLLAALTALAATGCSGSAGPTGGSAANEPPPTTAPASTQPPRAATTSPESPPSPPPPAADGHDVGACADGDCEVAVTEPVTIRFEGPGGRATLSVTDVGPNKVEYTVKSGNGEARGGASGPGNGCVTALRGNGSGTTCGGVGAGAPSPRPDAVVIQMSAGPDGTAILHIVSP